MKQEKSLVFSLFLLFLLLNTIIFLFYPISYARAETQEIEEEEILTANLNINYEEAEGLKVQGGGEKFKDWQNLGSFIQNGQTVYRSRVIMEAQVMHWTELSPLTDIWRITPQQKQVDVKILTLIYGQDPADCVSGVLFEQAGLTEACRDITSIDDFYASYNTWVLSSDPNRADPNTGPNINDVQPKARGFSGVLDVDVEIIQLLPEFVQIDSQTFAIPQTFDGVIESMRVVETERVQIGEFEDIIADTDPLEFDIEGLPQQRRNLVVPGFFPDFTTATAQDTILAGIEKGRSDAAGWIRTIGLRATKLWSDPKILSEGDVDAGDIEGDIEIQQGQTRPPLSGSSRIHFDGLDITLIPDIQVLREQITQTVVPRMGIATGPTDPLVPGGGEGLQTNPGVTLPAVTSFPNKRIVAWTIKNYAIRTTFEITIQFFSIVKLTASDLQTELDLAFPDLQFEDLYWTNAFFGTTGIIVPPPEPTFLEENLVLIIVVSIIVLLALGIRYFFFTFRGAAVLEEVIENIVELQQIVGESPVREERVTRREERRTRRRRFFRGEML